MAWKDAETRRKYETPYQREYREKNKERLREYRKEYKRKEYSDPIKRKRILEVNKNAPNYKRSLKKSQENWKVFIRDLHDLYIVGLLVRRSGLTREMVYANREIIDLYRQIILTKRLLKTQKNDNIRNKLARDEASFKRKFTWVTNWQEKTVSGKGGK
jgi:hypothetical protein